MTYILDLPDVSRPSPSELQERFAAYEHYLQCNEAAFPPSAYAFAIAPWHYDYSDSRCPHDAWVESARLIESKTVRQGQRSLRLEVQLLGARHDGRIHLAYLDVVAYSLEASLQQGHGDRGHGDWLIDEFSLRDHTVVHEVRFEAAKWRIECRDVSYNWHPMEASSTSVGNPSFVSDLPDLVSGSTPGSPSTKKCPP